MVFGVKVVSKSPIYSEKKYAGMINSMLSALCEKKQLPASAFFQGLSYYHENQIYETNWACIYKTLIHKALDA
jgi:hypothetical protein